MINANLFKFFFNYPLKDSLEVYYILNQYQVTFQFL